MSPKNRTIVLFDEAGGVNVRSRIFDHPIEPAGIYPYPSMLISYKGKTLLLVQIHHPRLK